MKEIIGMTRAEYEAAKAARTLVCPNTCDIIDEVKKIEFLYANPLVDIGISAFDNGVRKFYSCDEYDAMEVKPTDGIVYIATGNEILGIMPNVNNSCQWTPERELVPGCFINGILAQALLDFAGQANSDAVLAYLADGQLSAAPVFTWANSQVTPDGKVGFVPALGQLDVIALNHADVDYGRGLLNQPLVFNDNNAWWSSSQFAFYGAWHRSAVAVDGRDKNYTRGGLAVCAL